MILVAAASWGYGTQRMRHTTATVATLTLAFWMTGLTTLVMCVLSWVFEPYPWVMPSERVWWAIAYNAVGVFGFAQPAWLILARNLPPLASTLSVMFIPVLGAFSGALRGGGDFLLVVADTCLSRGPASPPKSSRGWK
jgi:drug/metabolite transporter (DMT)-like permease